jgi:hypothetical protein
MEGRWGDAKATGKQLILEGLLWHDSTAVSAAVSTKDLLWRGQLRMEQLGSDTKAPRCSRSLLLATV